MSTIQAVAITVISLFLSALILAILGADTLPKPIVAVIAIALWVVLAYLIADRKGRKK